LLSRSWINDETADTNFVRRGSSSENAEIVGRRDNGNLAGLLFANIWPGEDHVREWRVRRDKPDLVVTIDGAHKEHAKYLGPPGGGNLLSLPVGTRPDWLIDVNLPVVITEGCKQLLALGRLAWHDLPDTAERPRFLAIGLYGVWNWRGVIGKQPGPDGKNRDVKGPIPDLARLAFDERKVTIVYDSDARTNDDVRVARMALARYLVHERGAEVFFANIPAPKAKK
jgi:hypothetical protein